MKIMFILTLTFILFESTLFAQSPLNVLNVSKSCNTSDEKKNAKVVLSYFKNEIWWNIGSQRKLHSDDFTIEHTAVLTRMAPVNRLARKLLQLEDGIFRHNNFLNGWTMIAEVNSREYYHLNFHEIVCIGERVIVTSEFSGLVVNRNSKGEVTHAVKYGSPVTHIMKLKNVNGFQKIYSHSAILQDNNLSVNANKRLAQVVKNHPAPTQYCNDNLKNKKLGLKNSDKPIGIFDLNPLNKKVNPYRYNPSKKEQPLIECIDSSMTQTKADIFEEFKESLSQSGYEYDSNGKPVF